MSHHACGSQPQSWGLFDFDAPSVWKKQKELEIKITMDLCCSGLFCYLWSVHFPLEIFHLAQTWKSCKYCPWEYKFWRQWNSIFEWWYFTSTTVTSQCEVAWWRYFGEFFLVWIIIFLQFYTLIIQWILQTHQWKENKSNLI